MDDYETDGPQAHSAFGGRVVAAREAQKLTRDDLAARLGLSSKTVAGWENGTSKPRSNKTQMLAAMLNVSLRWLMSGASETAQEGVREAGGSLKDDTLREILHEMRALKSELSESALKLNRLEKQLEGTL